MNRLDVSRFLKTFLADLKNTEPALKPFLDLVLSLKRDLPVAIPLLRDLAAGLTEGGVLKRRIDRRYRRLCRVQEELGRLDFKKAAPGVSPEDYIFSRIDFSRYREMGITDFEEFVPEGLDDFGEESWEKNFGLGKAEIQSVIAGSYEKSNEVYRIKKENPLILSIMRTLETSLESLPLFTRGEIQAELARLLGFVSDGKIRGHKDTEPLYPLLVRTLDNVIIRHGDGMSTRLFISPKGELSGTFRPGDKPWTLVLIPAA